MQVTSHALVDETFTNWHTEVSGRWSYRDLYADDHYRNSWASFDCLAWHGGEEALYTGLTLMNNDILHRYDPRSARFTSLNFASIADRFDSKFHRSLEWADDGSLWGATALLHDMNDQHDAGGGKLVRYSPETGELVEVAVPVPHHYIQNIKLDPKRRAIYGFTYPAEHFFRYDIDSGTTRLLSYVGNSVMMCQPHSSVIDSDGGVWGTWGESRAFEDEPAAAPIMLFRYDQDRDEIDYFRHGLPRVGATDRATVDHMTLGRDGQIYVGTAAGALARIDPKSAEVSYLGKPFTGPRLAGLVSANDGYLYLAGNGGFTADGHGTARLARFDPGTSRFEDLGPIHDPARAATAAKVHMMVEGNPGQLFCAENDNVYRSSYLWEVNLG
jgi:hypothetical protein